jgi:glycosyltransferase involved in cell wall biosynthesis
MKATVSIILPTYNRARFLPQAIDSIRSQQFTDWELILVDDGSTDETAELWPTLTAEIQQPVRIIHQENQGAYAARNTGLDHATGRYIAFFDSDDLWLPHHLKDCVNALSENPDVDWVYGACRLVDADTNVVIAQSSFYDHAKPRPFLSLPRRHRGKLCVLESPGLLAAVLDRAGLYAGFQNSLIRSEVFADQRFDVSFYNEAQDQLAVARAIAAGHRFAYFENVHVIYQVHAENSSGSAKRLDAAKRIRLMEGLIRGYEGLQKELPLSNSELRELRRHLARLYFWQLGYSTLWTAEKYDEALVAYRKAISLWPWDRQYWKTYMLAKTRAKTPMWAKRCWWCLTDRKYRQQYFAMRQRVRRFQKLQRRAVKQILAQAGDEVLQGPFKGMIYTPARYGSYCAHVLLGTYEKELHPCIEEICASQYELIVNLGAADGYYACGLAIRNPTTKIIAYEADPTRHRRIHEFCNANGVENVSVAGRCDFEELRSTIGTGEGVCIVCDIDGPERELLDQKLVPALVHCDMLVETHDMLIAGITDALTSRFQKSHRITRIDAVPRTPDDLSQSVRLDPELGIAAMDEHRGTDMQVWLWLASDLNASLVTHAVMDSSIAR